MYKLKYVVQGNTALLVRMVDVYNTKNIFRASKLNTVGIWIENILIKDRYSNGGLNTSPLTKEWS